MDFSDPLADLRYQSASWPIGRVLSSASCPRCARWNHRSRRRAGSVGAESDGVHVVGVAAQFGDLLIRFQVPQTDRIVLAADRQACPVGAEGQPVDRGSVVRVRGKEPGTDLIFRILTPPFRLPTPLSVRDLRGGQKSGAKRVTFPEKVKRREEKVTSQPRETQWRRRQHPLAQTANRAEIRPGSARRARGRPLVANPEAIETLLPLGSWKPDA